MPLALRLGPIHVIGAIVQDHVVVDELDVPRLELDIKMVRWVVGQSVEQIKRLILLQRQARDIGEALCRLDVVSVAIEN